MSATQMTIKQLNDKLDQFISTQNANDKELRDLINQVKENSTQVKTELKTLTTTVKNLEEDLDIDDTEGWSLSGVWEVTRPYVTFLLKWAIIIGILYGVYLLGQSKNGTDPKPKPKTTIVKTDNSLTELPKLDKEEVKVVVEALDKSIKAIDSDDYVPGSISSEYFTNFITGTKDSIIQFAEKYEELKNKAAPPLVKESGDEDIKKNYLTLRNHLTQ
jgi:hypothetical protein